MNRIFKNKRELINTVFAKEESVLDVGFWGQGTTISKATWPHAILKSRVSEVYGIDLEFDSSLLENPDRYWKESAETFSLPLQFDAIFASDLIEHLPNPGLFLDRCAAALRENGRVVLTTPNCFNLFNLTEKISKEEPTVNADHTCYFNHKTLAKLLEKCGYSVESIDYVYTLEYDYPESWKKQVLNGIYFLLSKFTHKYIETLVVVARPRRDL